MDKYQSLRLHKKLLVLCFIIQYSIAYCQDTATQTTAKQGWTTDLNVGLDFLSNLLINPAIGGGESRLGFGASFGLNTVYNNARFSWSNALHVQYAMQKNGNGYLEDQPDKKIPFQKNIDNIWMNSIISQRTSYFSKFYYSADIFFSSQLTETYEDNYLSDVTGRGHPLSKFLSPAVLQFALGMDYRPNDYWSLFASPATHKSIIVMDDQIANDFALSDQGDFLGSIHGNPYEQLEDGRIKFENYDNQLGASIRIRYRNQISKRFFWNTNVLLFSNYQRDPDHIDVNVRNEIEVTIYKGLRLSLLSLLNYDHDVFVQITDTNQPNGTNGVGRRVSYMQQLVMRYSYTFDQKKEQNTIKK